VEVQGVLVLTEALLYSSLIALTTKVFEYSEEFKDFCGKHQLDFSNINQPQLQSFIFLLKKGWIDSLTSTFAAPDELAKYAAYAFSQNLITREQNHSLLELCEIKNAFQDVSILKFFDEDGEEFEKDALTILAPDFLSFDQIEKFKDELKKKPESERCYYTFKIPKSSISNDIQGLLDIAQQANIIAIQNPANIKRFDSEFDTPANEDYLLATYFCPGARDALTKALYGEHAKAAYAKLGKFNINDMDRSIRKYGRYLATYYPGISSGDNFHGVEARCFFLALHDEIHRRLISSIPNPIYEAYLHAIDIVRAKIGIPLPAETDKLWTKELWDGTDLEVGIFLGIYSLGLENPTLMTENFEKLLNAKIYTQNRPINLFYASALSDTTWLLLIDMKLNPSYWNNKNILPALSAANDFCQLYSCINTYFHDLEKISSPEKQVAYIKCKYFNLPDISKEAEVKFVKKKGHLQVEVDGKPILIDKNVITKYFGLEYLIQADVNAIAKIDLASESLLQSLRNFDFEIYYLLNTKKINIDDIFGDPTLTQPKFVAEVINNLKSHYDVKLEHILKVRVPLIAYLFKKEILSFDELTTLSDTMIDVIAHPIMISLIENNKVSIAALNNLSEETKGKLRLCKTADNIFIILNQALFANAPGQQGLFGDAPLSAQSTQPQNIPSSGLDTPKKQ